MTIHSIDTIETIYFKQDISRTNPRDVNDTIFKGKNCFQIAIVLENKSTGMPGFKTKLEDSEGDITIQPYYNRLGLSL